MKLTFRSLGDRVFREFPREDQANGGLDLAGRDGGLLRVAGELAGIGSYARVSREMSTWGRDSKETKEGNELTETFEDVVDERVENVHRLVRDANVGMDLLQDLVDVGRVGFDALLFLLFLVLVTSDGSFLDSLLRRGSFATVGGADGSLSGSRSHFCEVQIVEPSHEGKVSVRTTGNA